MVAGLSRDTYANGGKVREVIKGAFTTAGLPAFVPHSFCETLTIYGDQLCTTLSAYCPITTEMQADLIKGMADRPISA